MLRSLTGQGRIAPEKGDKRVKDPVWTSNPAYRALMQSYLAWLTAIMGWVDSLDAPPRDKLRARLVAGLATDALAPTNAVLTNPAAMQATLEQGSRNLVSGLRHLVTDLTGNGGLPSMVDKSKFEIGANLGVTEGAVVHAEDHLELIQYAPKTEQVWSRPVFIVPPQINKAYVWDLAPGRSIVEQLVSQGHQVFLVSWRNPGEAQSDWDLESYVSVLDRATEVACEISGSPDLNIVGACSGGITAALLLSLWGGAAAQQFVRHFPRRSRSLTLAATSAGFVMIQGNLRVLMKMATPKRYTDPGHMLEIGPDIYGGQLRFNRELLREHAAALKSSSQRGYLYQLLAGVGWTSWLWLPQLRLPVLGMMGGDDPIVPVVNGRILTGRLPDARLKVMDCGHLFILTDPAGTADAVESFLRGEARAKVA